MSIKESKLRSSQRWVLEIFVGLLCLIPGKHHNCTASQDLKAVISNIIINSKITLLDQ